ncbi:hypothetical protein BDZ88DRAFT_418290 [Geranomyces variabilis]|nr:hypothetical protein BDZ88DRAFT_418290 [Geranomyces variabilis]KAJ3140574.1 hypothetical protein HDU90_007874 [Geranomyces variabilis]
MRALAIAVWLALASGPVAAQNLYVSAYSGSDCSGTTTGRRATSMPTDGFCWPGPYNQSSQLIIPVQYFCNSSFVTASSFPPILRNSSSWNYNHCPGPIVDVKTVPVGTCIDLGPKLVFACLNDTDPLGSLLAAGNASVTPALGKSAATSGAGFPWTIMGGITESTTPNNSSSSPQRSLGGVCVLDSQCTTTRCTDGICSSANALAAGKACSTAADCASGNCLAGSCALKEKKAAVGQACGNSDSCETGKCVAAVCRLANTGPGASLVANRTSSIVGFKPNVAGSYSLPGNLGLALNTDGVALLNVTVSPDPPTGLTAPAKGISTYYNFDIVTNSSFSANLTFVYVDELLTALSYDPANLAWARFNTDSQQWESKPGIVDKVAKTVTYKTSNFSTWTVVSVTSSAATRLALTPFVFFVAVLAMTAVV